MKTKGYPVYTTNKVWHIGLMNIELKKRNSHEGAGLSVSHCPHAWEKIANCAGDVIELKKENGTFLDYYEMNDEQIRNIVKWGLVNGYIALETLYEYRMWSDDLGFEIIGLRSSYEEAFEETGDEDTISEKREQPIATEKLKNRTMGNAEPVMVLDLLTTVYAEDVLSVDGVWFKDNLDIDSLSAPRGVIVPSRITEWSILK